ncbi:hypothetical protein [Virgibacillus ihumii]|uniref:hypothetical protein n=1 Tax=Virgibacillus ihumii TaxID=2686091 RepID=UPI00157DE5BD|nr:hypothetical protein [Virgibacillus ihumii]
MRKLTETHKRKKKPIALKLLIGSVLFFVIVGSSLNVTFADKDIGAIITNWFDQKEAAAINEIREAVASEQATQTKRLKHTLKNEIKNAEEELHKQIKREKKKRIKAIQEHTDKLIKNFDINNTQEREQAINQLNAIQQNAIDKMNNVHRKTNLQQTEQPDESKERPKETQDDSTSTNEKMQQTDTKKPADSSDEKSSDHAKDKEESTKTKKTTDNKNEEKAGTK